MENKGYKIKLVKEAEEYEGLRALWCRVFEDEPGFVDEMYRAFGDEIEGYVITDETDKVVSALTCYKSGTYSARTSDGRANCDTANSDNSNSEKSNTSQKPVYVSYAICTDPEYRGLGLGGDLTSIVREIVTSPEEEIIGLDNAEMHGKNGFSLVSPAEESLIKFYENLGYKKHFFALQEECVPGSTDADGETVSWGDYEQASDIEDAASNPEDAASNPEDAASNPEDAASNPEDAVFDPEAVKYPYGQDEEEPLEPEISMFEIEASMYNKYRESFLEDIPHVALSGKMADFVKSISGLFLINRGDAICAVSEVPSEDASCAAKDIIIEELLVNPMLKSISSEIDAELAEMIAGYFGAEKLIYRIPGRGYCQSMIAKGMAGVRGQEETTDPAGACDQEVILDSANADLTGEEPAYYGFPIE